MASMLAEAKYPISTAALPLCRALAERTTEAVYVGLYDAHRAAFMYVEYIESLSPVNYIMPLYEWIPLSSGAGTMAILPFLPQPEIDGLLDEVMRRHELEGLSGTLKDLEQQLEEIRSQGYVLSVGQRIVGAVGIGAPILGPRGKLLGNIVLALPESRLARYDAHRLGLEVADVARAISQELGGSSDWGRRSEP
jgi:DNA-binding IclR family transcriptional regulator